MCQVHTHLRQGDWFLFPTALTPPPTIHTSVRLGVKPTEVFELRGDRSEREVGVKVRQFSLRGTRVKTKFWLQHDKIAECVANILGVVGKSAGVASTMVCRC